MKIVLHIGAHRTGSTMVEQALSRSLRSTHDCGLVVWTPRKLRDLSGFAAAPVLFDDEGGAHGAEEREIIDQVQDTLLGWIKDVRESGAHTLVIQEENILGSMKVNLRAGRFYPLAGPRLISYARLFPVVPDVIAMAVREYSAVWNSAYGYLRAKGKRVPPQDDACGEMPERARGWVDLAREVTKAWPRSELMMWQQEHLRTQALEIVAALGGLGQTTVNLPKKKINTTAERGEEAQLFSPRQRVILKNRYERNLTKLRSDAFAIRWVDAPDEVAR